MEIRTEEPTDRADVLAVIAAAFGARDPGHGRDVAALWADVLERGHHRLGYVATDGGAAAGAAGGAAGAAAAGTVIGHVGASHAWLDTRPALVDVLVLSPLSVHPEHQRRGVGAGLVAAAVEGAAALGAPALFLEGSPDYYGRQGFEPAGPRGFERPSLRIPEAAFQVVLLDGHEDWMRGRVVYRDVWWDHDATGLRDPRLAELEERFAGR
jgi:putative acetyltransferase